jgi:hypothetical protein
MTVGLSAVNLADAWLNTIRNTSAASFTAPTDIYIQCHSADPGAAGTNAVSTAITTRTVADWAASSGGSMALTATVSFAATGSQTISHIAAFSASTAGTFYWSTSLTVAKAVTSGDTLQLTACTIALTPIAA